MANSPVLMIEEVQEHVRDKPELNKLLDGEEFSPTVISIAIDLAISSFNTIAPLSNVTLATFPSRSLLMEGTIAKLLRGQAALKARNTMNYSDGGLQIPVEEQFPLYMQLAEMYEASFLQNAKQLKIHLNIEEGWGSVSSDYGSFPQW
jgi:hypothetical protein